MYRSEPLLDVSRPIEWEENVFSKAQHHSINIKKHDGTQIIPGLDNKMIHKANHKNPQWVKFTKYCQDNGIQKSTQLKDADDWVKEMLKNKEWKPAMFRHLEYRRKVGDYMSSLNSK